MARLFWLTEAQFARLSPLLPRNTRGKPRVDDRRVISGIVHALRSGGRGAEAQAIGRSRGGRTSKVHAVADGRGRPVAFALTPGRLGDVRVALELLAPLPPPRFCLADAAYDSGGLRRFLAERGTAPVIPNNPTRKAFHPFDRRAYRKRNLIERAFCRLKDLRRVATRYDRRADVFLSAVCLAAAVTWWL